MDDRRELNNALRTLAADDVIVVWKLDRLGRSLAHLIQVITLPDAESIGFRSLSEAIDTTTASGRLLFHIMGAIAEFERSLISEPPAPAWPPPRHAVSTSVAPERSPMRKQSGRAKKSLSGV